MVLTSGPESLHDQMERQRRDAFPTALCKRIRDFRDYSKGKQSIVLTTEQRRILMSILGHDFADNICGKILSVATGRTELLRWTCEDQGVEDWLMDELWLKNQYNSMQSDISYAALRDGNHTIGIRVHVTQDANKEDIKGTERVQLVHEPWWDGKCGMFVKYDEYGNVEYAVKEWDEVRDYGKKFKRRTFYYPFEIRRFILKGEGWQPYALPSDDPTQLAGVVPWVRDDGRPLGLPIIHFTSVLREDGSPYGISHIDGGVLAFQDHINSLQYDLSASALYAGYQMTWSTGTHLPTDPDNPGIKVAPKVGPGQHWHADEPEAKIGVIPAGDVESIKDSYRLKVQSVCRMTDTPLHFITGEWPSGEALLRSEIDLVELVRRFGEKIGPKHTETAHRSTEIYNHFIAGGEGKPKIAEDAPIVSKIADPQRRDRLTMSQIAANEEKYTSKAERLRITGRTDGEIDKILKEMQDEATADMEMATAALEAEAKITGVGEPGVPGATGPGGAKPPAKGTDRPAGDAAPSKRAPKPAP